MSTRKDTVLKPFREEADYLNERVEKGVAQYRRARFALTVRDESGRALPNAEVLLKQTSHDFDVGANLFMLDEFDTPKENEAYRALFPRYFNTATLPFYWADLEPEQGKPRYAAGSPRIYRRPPIDLCLAYCDETGVTPKAHCLNYDGHTPSWTPRDSSSMRFYLEKRFRELAERYADKIESWEVVNETLCAKGARGSEFYYDDDFVDWSFATAEKYFPKNRLMINECHAFLYEFFRENRSQYYMLIQRALAQGAPIDEIGLQFHMFYPREDEAKRTQTTYSPRFLYGLFDRYADFKLPLQITEMTIPAYSDASEDEEIQAEILKNLYRLWFSHPALRGVIYWNIVDGYTYTDTFEERRDMTRGENVYYGGLMRADLTPKPALETIRELFGHTWHTEARLKTDERGQIEADAFFGGYELTCEGAKARFALHKDDARETNVRVTR